MGTLQQHLCLRKTCCQLQARFHCKLNNDILALLYNLYRSERESTAFTDSKRLHDELSFTPTTATDLPDSSSSPGYLR